MTAGVRMLPCFPRVGDGADYGLFAPQTNGRIPLDQWIMVQGPSASVAQRTVEGHGFCKAKGIVLGIISFSTNENASFCRFLNLRSQCHDSATRESLCFCSAEAAVNCVLRELTESLFGSALILQSVRPPKFPVPLRLECAE